jgi:hypothetical protein
LDEMGVYAPRLGASGKCRCGRRRVAEELAKVLTLVVRQDRFAEGSLLSALECGSILAIVRRAEHLKSEDK